MSVSRSRAQAARGGAEVLWKWPALRLWARGCSLTWEPMTWGVLTCSFLSLQLKH